MSYARILALAAPVALTGCMTMAEIRQSEPVKTAELGANYKEAAACVAYEIADRYTVTSAVFESDHRAVLSYVHDNTVGPISSREPVFELTIRQDGVPAKSIAEFRSMKTLIGTTPWADQVWPAVEKCGHVDTAQR